MTVATPELSRRSFVKMLGGGIVVFFGLGPRVLLAQQRGRIYPEDFNAYLRIGKDGRVTLFSGKIEMGQGVMTSQAQMAADELGVSLDAVEMVLGDTDRCPWDAGTWGSYSTRYYGVFVKEASCEAKGVLFELAVERLGCPPARLVAQAGVIFDRNRPGNRVTYGELTQGRVIERHLKAVPPLKPVTEYTISGKPYLRRDAREKVTGEARFTGDIRLPDMVYAKILRPPAHGAKPMGVDTSAAEQTAGVEVVRDGDLVAVLHPYLDVAQQALARIKAQYDLPQTGVNDHNIFDHLLQNAPPPVVVGQAGDLQMGEKKAATIVEETYLNSYVAHAPMETHTALAHLENGKLTVWA